MPQGERRERLETVLGGVTPPVHLTPATRDRATAADWFDRFEGAGLDGVIAKRLDAPYQPGKRAMLKIKHQRTADCVVAGFRWHKNGPGTHVGSLLLGPVRRRGHAPSRRRHLVVHLGPPRRARRGAGPVRASAPSTVTRGASGPSGPRPVTPMPPANGCPARPRAGTAARTCPGSRFAPSASSRSPTTTSRATGSGTPRRSSAGARTSRPRRAATTSSRRRRRTCWQTIFGGQG